MKKKYFICLIIIFFISFFLYQLKENSKIKVIKKLVLDIDDVEDIEIKYIISKKEGKYGIIGIDGDIVKKFNYDFIGKLSSNNYFLKKENNQKIYNIESNKEIKIDEISYLGNDLYKISINGRYGIIDKDLNIKVQMINDEIYSNGKQVLVINGLEKYLLDSNLNKKILKKYYEKIRLGIGNYLYINIHGKYGVINNSEEVIVIPKYDEILNLNNKNILIGSKGGDSYFINLDKHIERRVNYENYSVESGNKIMVSKDDKIGYINDLGEEFIPVEYDGGFSFSDKKDFIQLKKGDSWYLLDLKTFNFKKLLFDDIGEYADEYMVVEKDEKFGYINKSGEIKIPLKYVIAEEFKEGIAIVGNENGFGVIDKSGKVVIELIYDKIFVRGSYIYVIKDEKYGLFSKKGREIIPTVYEKLGMEKDGIIYFKDNKNSGILKLNKN